MMQEWARAHGSFVRQRTVCQRETTMARAGMLPDLIPQKKIQTGEKKSVFNKSVRPKPKKHQHQDEEDEQQGTVENEVTEFDSSSDEESCAGESLVEEESDLGNLQITRDVDFLMGTTSRFGR